MTDDEQSIDGMAGVLDGVTCWLCVAAALLFILWLLAGLFTTRRKRRGHR